MRVTPDGLTFTAEEIIAAAEPDDRAEIQPGRKPSAWMVEYEVDSLFFGTSFAFRHRCDTEEEAQAYAASHALAHKVKVYPIYPLSAIKL